MLRKKYQDKYITKNQKIQEIESELNETFYLFEEIYEEIKKQDDELKTIEDSIIKSKHENVIAEEEVKQLDNINDINRPSLYHIIIGGGLGSCIIAYNPYIGIGGIIGGMIIGSSISYIYKLF